MRLLDLSTTHCLWLCWCTPATGVSRALSSIRRRWPSDSEDEAAGVTEAVSPAEGRQVTIRAALTREESGKRASYLVRMRLRVSVPPGQESPSSGRKSLSSDLALPFLRAVVPESSRKKARRVRFCGEFAYPLDQRRPIFELPVSVMGPANQGQTSPDTRLDGLMLSFPESKSGMESLQISVDDKGQRVRLRLEGRGLISLGDDPVRTIHDEAERRALAFTQEVASE